jgi:hypothetical protein
MMGTRPSVLSDVEEHAANLSARLLSTEAEIVQLAGTQGENWREMMNVEDATWKKYTDRCVCGYVCMYVREFVDMYLYVWFVFVFVCIYIYIYIYINV